MSGLKFFTKNFYLYTFFETQLKWCIDTSGERPYAFVFEWIEEWCSDVRYGCTSRDVWQLRVMWLSLMLFLAEFDIWTVPKCIHFLGGLSLNYDAVRVAVFGFDSTMRNWDHVATRICDLWDMSHENVNKMRLLSDVHKDVAQNYGYLHVNGVEGEKLLVCA